MGNTEIKKAQVQSIEKIIEYIPNSVVIKSIFKKPTGEISVVAIDAGEALTNKISPFDIFTQAINGNAEIIIDGNSSILKTGEMIIIPAHSSNTIKANVPFKMLTTLIKSGYEEVSWLSKNIN